MKDNPPPTPTSRCSKKMAKLGIVPASRLTAASSPGGPGGFFPGAKIANEKIMLWLKEGILAGDFKTGERLAIHYQGRRLWHKLHPAGLDHGHRPWANRPRMPFTDVGRAFDPQQVHGEKKYVMHSRRVNCRPPTFLVADDVRQGLLLCPQSH